MAESTVWRSTVGNILRDTSSTWLVSHSPSSARFSRRSDLSPIPGRSPHGSISRTVGSEGPGDRRLRQRMRCIALRMSSRQQSGKTEAISREHRNSGCRLRVTEPPSGGLREVVKRRCYRPDDPTHVTPYCGDSDSRHNSGYGNKLQLWPAPRTRRLVPQCGEFLFCLATLRPVPIKTYCLSEIGHRVAVHMRCRSDVRASAPSCNRPSDGPRRTLPQRSIRPHEQGRTSAKSPPRKRPRGRFGI